MQQIDTIKRLISDGQISEAITRLEYAVADDPTDKDALCLLGIAFLENNESEKAIKALVYLSSLGNLSPEALEALGCAYYKIGSYETARTYLQKAQLLNPQSPSILRNLGVTVSRLGYYETGLHFLEESARIAPDDYLTQFAIASTHVQLGQLKDAAEILHSILTWNIPDEFRKRVRLALQEISPFSSLSD